MNKLAMLASLIVVAAVTGCSATPRAVDVVDARAEETVRVAAAPSTSDTLLPGEMEVSFTAPAAAPKRTPATSAVSFSREVACKQGTLTYGLEGVPTAR